MSENHRTLSKNLPTFAKCHRFSIDCGTILSKLIYFDRLKVKSLKTHVFLTADLCHELESLGNLLEGIEEVYLTGTKKCYAKKIVLSLFNVNATFVTEDEALALGFKCLVDNVDESEVLYKVDTNINEENVHKFDMNNPMIKMMRKKIEANLSDIITSNDEKIKRPSILIWGGVTVRYYLLKVDGMTELISLSAFGGETYRGLAKCLIDSNNYGSITDLANVGRRENVDTQVCELFAEDPHSPYGKLPPQLPIFSYGKCADNKVNAEDIKIEDSMASLSHLVFAEISTVATMLCQIHKASSIYCSGGLFMASVFEKMIQIRLRMGFSKILVSILDCDYVLALGALLQDQMKS